MNQSNLKLLLMHRHSQEKHVLFVTDKTLEWVLSEIIAVQNVNVEIAPHYEISLSSLCAIFMHLHEGYIAEHRPLISEDWQDQYRVLTTKVLCKADKIKKGIWCVDTFWLWDWRNNLGVIAHESNQEINCEVAASLIQDAAAQQWL